MCKFYFYLKCFVILFVFSFFSCSSSNEEIIKYNLDDNLHFITEKKNEDLIWTRELESVRLLKDIKKIEGVVPAVKLNKYVVVATEDIGSEIYPAIKGFGSLDTTSISSELYTFLESFSQSISLGKIDESLFNSKSVFSYVLFENDLIKIWEDLFGLDMPSFSEEKEKNILDSEKVFTSWVYGKPILFDSEIQVPVRFIKKSKFIDILMFLSNDKIDQIQITQWGEINGK